MVWNFFKKKEKDATELAIEKIVDKMLQNADINASCIPDNLEKQLYINLLKLILGNLKVILDGVKVDFLEHEITIVIKPKEGGDSGVPTSNDT